MRKLMGITKNPAKIAHERALEAKKEKAASSST